jgi:gas vesicle protein
MRDYDDLPYIVIEKRSAGIGPFLWGALIGAGAALLLAPRPGAQTQEDIRRGVNRARSTVTRARERIEEGIETVRDRAEHVRDRVEFRADQARDTLESGRRLAHDAREEIERRVEDARDTLHAAADKINDSADDLRHDRGAADVVIVDVTEERSEGRADLG